MHTRNFYSFLHKRNRFYKDDVYLQSCKFGKEISKHIHPKFDIKKINVDVCSINRKPEKNGDFKEENKYPDFLKTFNFENPSFFEQFNKRHLKNAESFCQQVKADKTLQFKPDWRLAIGLGTGSIFETSMSLHHVYGFPYIPASAIKGVVRSYLITSIWGMEADNEAKAFNECKSMCDIFGCGEDTQWEINKAKQKPIETYYKATFEEDKKQYEKNLSKYRHGITEKSGHIIFFDAYPTESPNGKIKADIMNAHYQPYYSDKDGNTPPADYHKLNPIFFLTVEGLQFQFMVGLKKGQITEQ